MENKLLINKMKNAAELAWAAYGYYDLVANDTNLLFIKLKNEKENNEANSDDNFTKKEINLADIMDSTFANYEVYKSQLSPKLKPEKVATLKGDFTPTQAKSFFSRYDLLIHQPNTESGFSATLFGEKRKQRNIESKLLKELQCF